jgi:hypothetical protein
MTQWCITIFIQVDPNRHTDLPLAIASAFAGIHRPLYPNSFNIAPTDSSPAEGLHQEDDRSVKITGNYPPPAQVPSADTGRRRGRGTLREGATVLVQALLQVNE